MSRVTVSIPGEALEALNLPPEEAADELRLAAAIKLYEVGRLSSGAAAEIAGLTRTEFIMALGRFNVSPLQYTAEELREELAGDE